ncbi:MAG: DUF1667 domain-containing protein [Clostridia bacterium]
MQLTCINCPLGCQITVEKVGQELIVSGNTCKRGEIYAKQEFSLPKRMLTSLVKTNTNQVVPVKSSAEVPKNKLFDILALLKDVVLTHPVSIGDVVLSNCLGLGIDIVVTKNI